MFLESLFSLIFEYSPISSFSIQLYHSQMSFFSCELKTLILYATVRWSVWSCRIVHEAVRVRTIVSWILFICVKLPPPRNVALVFLGVVDLAVGAEEFFFFARYLLVTVVMLPWQSFEGKMVSIEVCSLWFMFRVLSIVQCVCAKKWDMQCGCGWPPLQKPLIESRCWDLLVGQTVVNNRYSFFFSL